MDYKEKYIKYKQKYLNLKYKLHGGIDKIVDTYSINGNTYILKSNIFDNTNATKYDSMIDLDENDNSLIIFNDNYDDYKKLNVGSGNAKIRPYKEHLRCWGIPTGDRAGGTGFVTLDQIENGKTVKQIIDDAITDIQAIIYKRLNSVNPVKTIIYSGFEGIKIRVGNNNPQIEIPTIAQSIFTIGKIVQIYIISELYSKVFKHLHDMKKLNFTYEEAKSYTFKTASELKKLTKIKPDKPIKPDVVFNTALNDGFNDKTQTGSIDVQLNIKVKSPLYNLLIGTLQKIDKRLNKKKIKDRDLHISLFIIIYNKNHPNLPKDFNIKLNKLLTDEETMNTLKCLTEKYKEQIYNEDLKFTLTPEFEILGSNPDFKNNFITQILKINDNTKQIISQIKSYICVYLFGTTKYADANPNPATDPSKVKKLDQSKYDKQSFYYFKNDVDDIPLYKIKKFYNFDVKYSDGFKCHVSLGYINEFSDIKYKEKDETTQNFKDIKDITEKSISDNDKRKELSEKFKQIYKKTNDEEIDFTINFEFKLTHRD